MQAIDCLERLFSGGNNGAATATSTEKARVLLVDDDRICNLANEVALKRANYQPHAVLDAKTAIIALNDYTFDLVLLDIDMPE
jgi:PleD family two-component response regulator